MVPAKAAKTAEIDEDLSTEGLLRGAPAPRSQFQNK